MIKKERTIIKTLPKPNPPELKLIQVNEIWEWKILFDALKSPFFIFLYIYCGIMLLINYL